MKRTYLGIEIYDDRNGLLTELALKTLKERYMIDGETSPQESFARASVAFADDLNHAQRVYDYVSKQWLMFATPILSNGGTDRGFGISCFLNAVPDSREGLSSHYDENIWLASNGGGIGGYWGGIRSDGSKTTSGSKSSGSIPFLHVVDSQMLAFNQGTCYVGPGHEVLTDKGWIKFEDLSQVKNLKIYQVLKKGGRELVVPLDYIEYEIEDETIEFRHERETLVHVTKNHGMVYINDYGVFGKVSAEEIEYKEGIHFPTHEDGNCFISGEEIEKVIHPRAKHTVRCVEVPSGMLLIRYKGKVSVCGNTRRGSYAAYQDISHPEIEEFIGMRKPTGGDIHRKCMNLHHGVNIPDSFMQIIERCMKDPEASDDWDLIDPHSKRVVRTVSAKELWAKLLETRVATGEPYIHFIDRSNEALPQAQKDLGLFVRQSNLCSEITEATDEIRTAVCCLSSFNLAKWEEWKEHISKAVPDLIRFLDNVLEDFIWRIFDDSKKDRVEKISSYYDSLLQHNDFLSQDVIRELDEKISSVCQEGKRGLRKAAFSAYRERSLGMGSMGFHSLLQSKNIPFESPIALGLNNQIFSQMIKYAKEESQRLARERGAAPDLRGTGYRNAHLMAIAPNASSSKICGGVSPSIEPDRAVAFTEKTLSGSFLYKNKYFQKLLESKGLSPSEISSIWKSVINHKGSCQHLDVLDDWEKQVFKTAMEIDQSWVIEHAAMRQKYICQSQSLNVFFRSDDEIAYLHGVHFKAWKSGLKTLYYCRSSAPRRAENVEERVERRKIDYEECIACEG